MFYFILFVINCLEFIDKTTDLQCDSRFLKPSIVSNDLHGVRFRIFEGEVLLPLIQVIIKPY